MSEERTYRNWVAKSGLATFHVTVQETDLMVHAEKNLADVTRELVLKYRGYLESYMQTHPDFIKTLNPWKIKSPAPIIIKDMAAAGERAGVGPMAAVAGAIAEHVGRDLLRHSSEVIIENGGDVFIKTHNPVTIGIFAGESPLSLKIGLRIDARTKPVSVCTSSGRVGHSLSFGKADAVCVVAEQGPLADASATSICNRVKSEKDINRAIDFGKKIKGVEGIVIVFADQVGFWGELEVIPLGVKKG